MRRWLLLLLLVSACAPRSSPGILAGTRRLHRVSVQVSPAFVLGASGRSAALTVRQSLISQLDKMPEQLLRNIDVCYDRLPCAPADAVVQVVVADVAESSKDWASLWLIFELRSAWLNSIIYDRFEAKAEGRSVEGLAAQLSSQYLVRLSQGLAQP